MSQENVPGQFPATANGAAVDDNISDVGFVPPSGRALAAAAQASEAMRQATSSSSTAAVPTHNSHSRTNRYKRYGGYHTPTTTGNGLCWTTIPDPKLHSTTTALRTRG